MITLVLADDHSMVRQGLRAVLEAEPDFQILGEAGEGVETIHQVEHWRPDILVMDLMMPGLNGLEVIRQVRQRVPTTRVVVLTMHANESYVLEALRAGAMAYVLKESNVSDLIQAIREVRAGRRYLSPPLSERAIEAYLQKAQPEPEDPLETLSPREREVFFLVVQGETTPAIAARLFLSPRTVEIHRRNLMRKLNLRTQTDLIRYALQRGIIPLE